MFNKLAQSSIKAMF
ncbi:TPA: hypothetical protein ACQ8V0_003654 [Escherichia coli]|nr:hypothetical protein [Escherichia coli]EJL4320690.1 hypothetical protein [Escherichia coli]EMF1779671.1 hypothetical protein [Escherichia coli]MBI1499799.1 hypothetical protein [Escherichia coli]MBI1514161.1 hypothetical protein [Escherichia coli]MCA8662094.1 hypothetical protein [Escherichia coli]